MTETFISKLKYYVEKTESYLFGYGGLSQDVPKILSRSMIYSLEAGGKRLRPALLMAASEVFSDRLFEETIAFAASIEMIHTYSLIHDDLPAMDDDDLRRGKPSNHIVFGEAGAMLAGDALLNCAVENILNIIEKNPQKKFIEAASLIMKAAGPTGMIGGQVLDIIGVENSLSMKNMHNMKTGALIQAAVQAGGILGGCSVEEKQNLGEYAYNIGCAFQIKDDILDVGSTSEVLGKPVGSDSRNSKTTYVSIYGMKKAEEMLNNRIEKAAFVLNKIDSDTTFLREMAFLIRDRKD